ncbi:unnamed protein product [Cylindrotheca closterium]|uniref:Uncharacterized protein n=1 Tax=Cylindrotheca closterium TaxID=2856 RepID=A0AAD2CB35_9STRA|nr:unnamed protein product [Cylindrotheca closterium]
MNHLLSSCLVLSSALAPVAAFSPQSLARTNRQPLHTSQLSSTLTPSIESLSLSASTKPDEYLRWKKDGDTWKMQTAVTTFQKGDKTVELHAQLHFGDSSYFDYYNDDSFNDRLDHVHYELLVDSDLLQFQNNTWRLEKPIMASANDQSLAQSYGWECQASKIDYTHPKWIHADLTRQEFRKIANPDANAGAGAGAAEQNNNTPLWALAAGPQSSSTAAEAVSALLVGPPTLSYSAQILKRRLFTNLFIPGETFANSLRAILWFTVPAPELSIILLDWSSLLKGGSNPNALSEVALPILSSLVKLDVGQIRRFLFGQVLMSSAIANKDNDSSAWSLLVTKRNDHALEVLNNTLHDSGGVETSTALLYGSSHCPDLHAKLTTSGFKPTKTTWRTAWSVQENEKDSVLLVSLLGAVGLYLSVGALDWVGMMGDVSQDWVGEEYLDTFVGAGAYLVRHVLLYLGLSKFLVDWTNKDR